jgi:transposase
MARHAIYGGPWRRLDRSSKGLAGPILSKVDRRLHPRAAKYQQLREAGKPAKVALVALMRKLIEIANALIKADRRWAERPACA